MEYFLPLSVMAMIISSISIFLIDYQQPIQPTDPENDQNPSDPTDPMDDSADEILATENESNLLDSTTTEGASDQNIITQYHFSRAKLRAIFRPFSILWTTTHKSIISVIRFN